MLYKRRKEKREEGEKRKKETLKTLQSSMNVSRSQGKKQFIQHQQYFKDTLKFEDQFRFGLETVRAFGYIFGFVLVLFCFCF